MADSQPLPPEAEIIINGQKCTFAESMTVRVALGAFLMDLHTDGLGDDSHGIAICHGYKAAIASVHRKMKLHRQTHNG